MHNHMQAGSQNNGRWEGLKHILLALTRINICCLGGYDFQAATGLALV